MSEKNKHILEKVIRDLPLYNPADASWDTIKAALNKDDVTEINKHVLKKTIQDLPSYGPNSDFFGQIEKKLDKQRLGKIASQLPVYNPADSLWNKIEEKLDYQEATVISINRTLKYSIRIAASLLLLMGSYVLFNYYSSMKEKVEISYSTETFVEPLKGNNEINSQMGPIEFIKVSCLKLPDICARPQVNNLKMQLDELEQEVIRIKQMIEQDQNNKELLKSLIRIEKEKTKISKKLIQYIIV